MDILYGAIPQDGGIFEAKRCHQLLAPDIGQVPDRERTGNQRLLDLVAHDDMQRIGHLVGLDADQARLDLMDQGQKCLKAEIRTEMRIEFRQGENPEGGRARQLHLDEKALALMQGHAARPSRWQMRQGFREVLLIKPVTCLVQGSHQRTQELPVAIARGQPHIARHAATERMQRDRQAAMLEIEAQRCDQFACEPALGVNRVAGRARVAHTLAPLPVGLDGLGKKRGQFCFQR